MIDLEIRQKKTSQLKIKNRKVRVMVIGDGKGWNMPFEKMKIEIEWELGKCASTEEDEFMSLNQIIIIMIVQKLVRQLKREHVWTKLGGPQNTR